MSSTRIPSIGPWLAVSDAQRLAGDQGIIAVAQLSIGDAVFWVQDDLDASPDGRG